MISLSQDIVALAHRMAVARHLPVEEIVRAAVEEKARAEGFDLPRRDRSTEEIAARRMRTERFVATLAAMPILDERSPREITDDLNLP